jgi:nicotinamidase-related amidase
VRRTTVDRGGGRVIVPASGTALLLIDVINDLAFSRARGLIAEAEAMARRIAALKRRAAAAGVPVIYLNDNFGRWQSNFQQTVAHCTARSSPGHRLSRRLRPLARDYFVLKPRHSGFFGTTLEVLLAALRVERLILTGIAGNICVLFTAHDAYMRGFKLFIPADCVVSNTSEENEQALAHARSIVKAKLVPSTRLRFRRTAGGSAARRFG